MEADERWAKIDGRLDRIEIAITKLSVQEEKILNIQVQQSALWKKYDEAFSPKDGVVTKIANHQASCPRDEIKKIDLRLWGLYAGVGILAIVEVIKALMP